MKVVKTVAKGAAIFGASWAYVVLFQTPRGEQILEKVGRKILRPSITGEKEPPCPYEFPATGQLCERRIGHNGSHRATVIDPVE